MKEETKKQLDKLSLEDIERLYDELCGDERDEYGDYISKRIAESKTHCLETPEG